MALTLKNFAKELPKDLVQLAEKNEVRECDETEKGNFIAYVDEGKETFDVSVTILPDGEIGKSACDCKNGAAYCRHKAALLLHIAKDQKTKSPVVRKKKPGKVETILGTVDFNDLKYWLKVLIEKNKEIEFSFINHFSPKPQRYVIEDVTKLIKDAIKATGAGKKSIDNSQLKKVAELLAGVLQPIVEYYHLNIADEQAFLCFHTLVQECLQFQAETLDSSKRMSKYITDILLKSEAAVNDLQNEDTWFKATGFFVETAAYNSYGVKMYYLKHLKNILAVSNFKKREKIIAMLAGHFSKSDKARSYNESPYARLIFDIIENAGLFPKYYKILKPIFYENEYNQKLIRLLIKINRLELAAKYCDQQIRGNYQGQYDVPYLKLLREIYTMQNDEAKIAMVLTKLLPITFDFDDYLYVIARIDPDEQKQFRGSMMSRARNERLHSGGAQMKFSFTLLNHEKNYRKMIDYIDDAASYDVILKYFEPMFSAGKERLLNVIIQKKDGGISLSAGAENPEYANFPQLFELLKKHYTADYLRSTFVQLEKNHYYRPNRLCIYITHELNKLQ
jgi:mRNA-degrading endonuclease YafQ of YafQ-DinJ toxin-antitoxin module